MNKCFKAILCASMSTIPMLSMAQEIDDRWVYITSGASSNVFYDKKTLTKSMAWVKYETLPDRYRQEKNKRSVIKYYYDCSMKRIGNGGGYKINLAGERFDIEPSHDGLKEVDPESIGERVLDSICANN